MTRDLWAVFKGIGLLTIATFLCGVILACVAMFMVGY